MRYKRCMADDSKTEAAFEALEIRMLEIQQAYHRLGLRAILAFEGTDAAGKGGTIKRLVEKLDPRGLKVWPIGPPGTQEHAKHYLYRFWARLPEPGTIAIFDRSWYGRVLVERVDGITPKAAWTRAYREINEFERLLADDGVRVVKLFLDIDKKEQLRRFRERAIVPYKRWKLGESDLRAHEQWSQYQRAYKDMIERCSTRLAPWHRIDMNDKDKGRLRTLRVVTQALARDVELRPPALDAGIRKRLEKLLGESLKT
jgi:polyphosphate kinase 2 (PPK2 family)